jgi:hypothetical protein
MAQTITLGHKRFVTTNDNYTVKLSKLAKGTVITGTWNYRRYSSHGLIPHCRYDTIVPQWTVPITSNL